MPGGLIRGGGSERGDVGVQAEQLVPQDEAEGDPACLPAGAAEVQPACRRAEHAFQLSLPAVVCVAVHRVVREIGSRRVEQAEQRGAQRRGFVRAQHTAVGQLDQMGQVGEGKPAMQQRRVAGLQRIPGLNQLGRWPAGDPARGAQVALGRLPGHGPAPANRVGAPPLTRNTWVSWTRPAWHSAISAAIAFAPKAGSRNTPSVRTVSRAAA